MTRQIPTYTTSGVPSLSSQPDQTPIGDEYQPQVEEDTVPPVGVGHILGEGPAIFTDMTETMLTALDKQMAQPDTVQRSVSPPVNTLYGSDPMLAQSESRQGTPDMGVPQPLQSQVPTQEPKKLPIPPLTGECVYPDLYLPITENHKISDKFYGYTDSVSADNNTSGAEWTILQVWDHSICCRQNTWYYVWKV